MDLTETPDMAAFREEVRSFLSTHAGDYAGGAARDLKAWQKLLIDNGYAARTIPREYGGYGAEPDILKSRIIAEEFIAAGAPRGIANQGVSMLVPTLLEVGSEEQKRRWIELDLPGQLAQELVGYPVGENSPYLRRRLIPSWAKPTLLVRNERSTPRAKPTRCSRATMFICWRRRKRPKRSTASSSICRRRRSPMRGCWGLLRLRRGDARRDRGNLRPADRRKRRGMTLAEDFAAHLMRPAKQGDVLPLGSIAVVAHTVVDGRVTNVGLRLADPDTEAPRSLLGADQELAEAAVLSSLACGDLQLTLLTRVRIGPAMQDVGIRSTADAGRSARCLRRYPRSSSARRIPARRVAATAPRRARRRRRCGRDPSPAPGRQSARRA